MLILQGLSVLMLGYLGLGLLSWWCTGKFSEFTEMVSAGVWTSVLFGGMALIVALLSGGF